MADEIFEVAVSRFTFAGAELLAQDMVSGLRQVTHRELLELLCLHQLQYIQSTLHMGKSLAIGSADLAPAGSKTRQYNAMIILTIDDRRPVEADAQVIASRGNLEIRQQFVDPSAARSNHSNAKVA
ncbi:hypothetical protein [Pseudomonas sp. EMN2]|uniref:hypothetical protein n=1 Tax=Pseudomonas sp. EMN2 TaxID=2615212 RepID=UPI00129A39EB|nr:hypothetical protein [Pseudomonas sp. EMN2]